MDDVVSVIARSSVQPTGLPDQLRLHPGCMFWGDLGARGAVDDDRDTHVW